MKRLYNHYFPTPAFLAMNAFAIDISDQSVKYGELISTSEGPRIGRHGKEKIQAGVVVSGKIEQPAELTKILKKIKDREHLSFVRVSLPEEQMYLFTLSLPRTKNQNIRDMILLQIEEYVPLKAPDVIFDFDIISEDNQNINVEVVAAANTMIDSYLAVFQQADLSPLSFEIEAQAIARAVIPALDKSPVMVVDFGDARTVVSVSKNGRVFLTTTLAIGGIDLTNMIAKNFSLTFDQAEKMKHEYGLNQVSKAQNLFPAILNGISVLRDELNKQYLYWETHNSNNPEHEKIDRIILCGGDANLAGLSDYLELSMKIKVENANVWVNILDIEHQVPEMSFEESLGYATILGLSLGGYDYKSEPVINILPSKEKSILHREYWMRLAIMVLNMYFLVGIVAGILLTPAYFLSQARLSLATEKLELFNQQNPNLFNDNMDKITKDINTKLGILNNMASPYQINDKVLNSLLLNRTTGVTFSQILFSKKDVKAPVVADKAITVTKIELGETPPPVTKTIEVSTLEVHGQALNRDALRTFKTALDANPNFSKVELPISNFLEKADLIFTISITLK